MKPKPAAICPISPPAFHCAGLPLRVNAIFGERPERLLRERLLRFAAQSAPELGHFHRYRWLPPMHLWQAEYLLGQDWCQRLGRRGPCRIR